MEKKVSKLIIENGDKVYEFVGGSGEVAPDSVGTEQIKDDTVMMEDLNRSVKEKIQKTYDEEDESLLMDFDEKEKETE